MVDRDRRIEHLRVNLRVFNKGHEMIHCIISTAALARKEGIVMLLGHVSCRTSFFAFITIFHARNLKRNAVSQKKGYLAAV